MISKGQGVTVCIVDAASRSLQKEPKKLTNMSVITAKIQCKCRYSGFLAPGEGDLV